MLKIKDQSKNLSVCKEKIDITTTPPNDLKFIYEDYLGFPEDGNRHELIDGEHYLTPVPFTKHQRISSNLLAYLHHHCQLTHAGLVLAAPTDVVFSENDVVQPDLVFITKSRKPIVTRENIQGAPDFITDHVMLPSISSSLAVCWGSSQQPRPFRFGTRVDST